MPVKVFGVPRTIRVISLVSDPSICAAGKRAQVGDRGVDPGHELDETLLLVFHRRGLDARQPRAGAAREVGRQLHLARQRKHVGRKSRPEQRRLVDLLRGGMGGRLGEDCLEIAEHPDELGHRGTVHGDGHSIFLCWCR